MITLYKQKLFIVFNRARQTCKQQQREDEKQILDRLYKALGILQHHDYYEAEKALYNPNRSTCNCRDWEFHNAARRKYTGPCKHMTAEIFKERMMMIEYHQLPLPNC
jgi:hypothetical protein